MKKFKQKLLLRPPSRNANATEDLDLHASSAKVLGTAYGGEKSKQESGPWGLKELYPGRDAVVE